MNILWCESIEPNKVGLSTALYREMSSPSSITVRFGTMAKELVVSLQDKLPEESIALPRSLTDSCTIPSDIPYEVFIKDGQVFVGPLIAFVVLGTFKQLNNETLSSFLPWFIDYGSIRGLLFVCTADAIDLDNSIIEGYYFNPYSDSSLNVWHYGKFPLPNAVFNRSFLSQNKINILRERIGDKIFNSYWYNLNKLHLWQRLAVNQTLKGHLPYTEKFTSIEQLNDFLKRYGSAYIKPFSQSRGRGIVLVTRTDSGFTLFGDKKRTLKSTDGSIVGKILQSKMGRCVIQQAVPFKRGNQQLDFRVFLQRGGDKSWRFSGYVSRTSQEGSIITNLRGCEKLSPGRDALTTIFGMNEDEVVQTEQEMFRIVREATKCYEQLGMHLGDLAADIILDADRHLWLLELQFNYGEKGFYILPEVFRDILANPFRYAKALSYS